MVGNYCYFVLGGHATALQLQPSLTHLMGLETSQIGDPSMHEGPSGMVEAAVPISSGSLPHRCLVAHPKFGPLLGAQDGGNNSGITSYELQVCVCVCVCVCV